MNRKIKWTHNGGNVTHYPVRDAVHPLTFIVNNSDVKRAKNFKGYADPNCCVMACAVRRQFSDSVIFRDVAYILQIYKGKVYATRYRLGSSLRKAVASFDSKGLFTTGNYNLLAPTHSQTLVAKRRRAKSPRLTKRKVRQHTKFSARGRVTPLS